MDTFYRQCLFELDKLSILKTEGSGYVTFEKRIQLRMHNEEPIKKTLVQYTGYGELKIKSIVYKNLDFVLTVNDLREFSELTIKLQGQIRITSFYELKGYVWFKFLTVGQIKEDEIDVSLLEFE